jgi:hypothetical protein
MGMKDGGRETRAEVGARTRRVYIVDGLEARAVRAPHLRIEGGVEESGSGAGVRRGGVVLLVVFPICVSSGVERVRGHRQGEIDLMVNVA